MTPRWYERRAATLVIGGSAVLKGKVYVAYPQSTSGALDSKTGAKSGRSRHRGEHGSIPALGRHRLRAFVVIGNAGGDMNGGGNALSYHRL